MKQHVIEVVVVFVWQHVGSFWTYLSVNTTSDEKETKLWTIIWILGWHAQSILLKCWLVIALAHCVNASLCSSIRKKYEDCILPFVMDLVFVCFFNRWNVTRMFLFVLHFDSSIYFHWDFVVHGILQLISILNFGRWWNKIYPKFV